MRHCTANTLYLLDTSDFTAQFIYCVPGILFLERAKIEILIISSLVLGIKDYWKKYGFGRKKLLYNADVRFIVSFAVRWIGT